jgi:uncharacterized protein YrrD
MENTDETVSLISASKVQGTNVYNTDGDSLGEVYDVMIDKRSGKVAYAITAAFSASARTITRCRGTPSNMTPAKAVMWWG